MTLKSLPLFIERIPLACEGCGGTLILVNVILPDILQPAAVMCETKWNQQGVALASIAKVRHTWRDKLTPVCEGE